MGVGWFGGEGEQGGRRGQHRVVIVVVEQEGRGVRPFGGQVGGGRLRRGEAHSGYRQAEGLVSR